MKRRSFLAMLGLAPLAPIAAAGAAAAVAAPKAFADGGRIGPIEAMVGEIGPEAIMPFTCMRSADGKLVITADRITINS